MIEKMHGENHELKRTVMFNLQAQMQHRKETQEENARLERQADQENLHYYAMVQAAENQAQQEKIMNEKRTLKKAWEK